MSISRMHDEYYNPDRYGLFDEQPLDLVEGKTLKGYGRTGHGLNGKDADLDYGGQNVVNEAWWFSDGTIQIHGHRYASIVPNELASDEQMDIATELVGGAGYRGEWDGDYWVLGEDYSIEAFYENDDSKTDAENLDAALRVSYDAIEKDSEGFENSMTDLAKEVGAATK